MNRHGPGPSNDTRSDAPGVRIEDFQATLLSSRTAPLSTASSLTPVYVGALSAAVVPTLESAQIYEPVGDPIRVNGDGELLPSQSKKRKFPPGLRRFRDRLHTLDTRLQLEVNALKQEISDLNTQAALLETRREARRTRLADVTSQTVRSYFNMFRNGVSTTDPKRGQCQDNNQLQDHGLEEKSSLPSSDGTRPETSTLYRFLDAVAHPKMRFGPFENGRDALITQWRRYSKCLDSINCALSSFSDHGSPEEPIVVAVAVLSGFVTQEMVGDVFPHVLDDAEVVRRLVGAYIEYPIQKFFHFNCSGQIIRLDWSVDFVAAVQVVVGKIALVKQIVGGAVIQENGYIGHK